MGELVEAIPETLLISAEDTSICPTSSQCFETPHGHRIDLSLRSVKPARRMHFGDQIDIKGTFRLVRLQLDQEELLAEGALTKGTITRPNNPRALTIASLSFELGRLVLSAKAGESWDSPELSLQR